MALTERGYLALCPAPAAKAASETAALADAVVKPKALVEPKAVIEPKAAVKPATVVDKAQPPDKKPTGKPPAGAAPLPAAKTPQPNPAESSLAATVPQSATPTALVKPTASVTPTASATSRFTPGQCAALKALVSSRLDKALDCATVSTASGQLAGCYATPDDLLQTVNKQADSHLALEDEALVQKELVHLRPVSPIPLPGATLQWLTALVGVLALFFIKGMALLGLAPSGLAPVQILQGVLRQAAVGQPMEKVGTRLLFERHFRLITELLGKRRLVLFIDDLDRCDHEYTRQVLEVSNFLASSGDLFMVLGLAPRYVLANVTLSFQDLAKAVHEADMLNGNGQTSGHDAKAGQSWFARQYLQKLIHIEVPVPRPENAQVLAMLTLEGGLSAQEKALEKVEEREQQLDQMLATAGRFLQVGLLLAALGGGVYLGLNPGWYADNPAETKSVAATLAAPATERDNPAPATQPPPEVKPNEPNKATGSADFVEGYSAKNYQNWPLWLALALAATLMLGGMVLFRLVQRLDKLEDKPGLAWMQTLLKRLKIWLLGPESKKDTRDFMDALKFWHGLIAAKNPSPRTIKAFVNRLRYFASRDASEDGNGREAQLVALATIFYAFEENIQGDLNLSAFYDEILNSPAGDQQDKRRLIFADAWREHVKAFGAPSAQDLQFYQALSEDIIIHRSD